MQNSENNFMFYCKIRAKLIFEGSGLRFIYDHTLAGLLRITHNDAIHFDRAEIIQ
jgi:hypothetical protein